MDISNPAEFAKYCQERPDSAHLARAVSLADKIIGLATKYHTDEQVLNMPFGGEESVVAHFFADAFVKAVHGQEEVPSQDEVRTACEVIARFSPHGVAFKQWSDNRIDLASKR